VELPPEIPLTLQMMEDPVVPFSGDGERDAMIGGERGRGGRQAETRASLNGDRGLRFWKDRLAA